MKKTGSHQRGLDYIVSHLSEYDIKDPLLVVKEPNIYRPHSKNLLGSPDVYVLDFLKQTHLFEYKSSSNNREKAIEQLLRLHTFFDKYLNTQPKLHYVYGSKRKREIIIP